MLKKPILLFFIGGLSLVLVYPVFAQGTNTSLSPTAAKPALIKDRIQAARQKNLEIRENLKMRASEAAQKRAEKLSEARLRLCEARKRGIAQRIKFMLQRGKTIHTGHEKIYQRVDEFYNNRLVPNGYTLPNYNDLKAEVEANKANVQTLLDAAGESGEVFDCSSADPLGQAKAFQDDIKALIEANRQYKESVRNFVKAVRDLAKTARLDKISPSATPSATPEVGE